MGMGSRADFLHLLIDDFFWKGVGFYERRTEHQDKHVIAGAEARMLFRDVPVNMRRVVIYNRVRGDVLEELHFS